MPVVDDLAKKHAGRIKFARIQTDHNQATASRYDVLSLPTLLLFKSGHQLNRLVGSLSREQLEYQLAPLL
jgi:thioredoxin-like negative regulator of GroEL